MIKFIKNIFKNKKSLTQKNAEKANIAIEKMKLKKSTSDYVQQLEQELRTCTKEDGLTNARFNQIESTYEKAKHQNPNHPSVKTFVNIAREYYKQKINQAEKKGENTIAYNMALQRYTQ